jgi:hypothetical protein
VISAGDRVIATSHEGHPHGTVDKVFPRREDLFDGREVATVTYDDGAWSIRFTSDLIPEN